MVVKQRKKKEKNTKNGEFLNKLKKRFESFLERWLSGLKRRFAKLKYLKYHGFKSHSFH